MTNIQPTCVYRFQFTPEDNFASAASLVPYLASLGVSHLYMSPISEAVAGSQHGYDVVDPSRIRDELGGEDEFAKLVRTLDDHGIGWLVDIVPNHLSSADPEANPWFWHVLRFGVKSPYADTFDIDWDAADGRMILPVVDQSPEELVDAGRLEIVDRRGERQLQIDGGFHLPLDPDTVLDPLRPLLDVIADQHYVLAPWRSTNRNVRRFFEIDSLVAVSIEKPDVRDARHELLRRILHDYPSLSGVRVDHIDGLADPDGYLHWLRDLIGPDRILLVEKILLGDEQLPERWPVDGTTGYEFARLADRLLLDGRGADQITETYRRLTGDQRHFHAIETEAINEVLRDRLSPDVRRIASLVGQSDEGVISLAAAFDRYRTYLPDGGAADEDYLRQAAQRGGHGAIALAETLIDPSNDAERKAVSLFQQLTGPALAKGIEDRGIYRFVPLAALNEVGGAADSAQASVAEFHQWAAMRADRHPRGMLTTSTHDTKRSGDVRARLLALARRPKQWHDFCVRWMPQGDIHPIDRYFILQHTIGAWPLSPDRLVQYVHKALREAAERTSWIDGNDAYEAEVEGHIRALFDDPQFATDAGDLVDVILPDALSASLAQTLLRLTAPGFGDLYRGDEVIDLSLVDPDNRRPLDWDDLSSMAAEASSYDVAEAMAVSADRAKLALIQRTLAARARANPSSTYEPLGAPQDVLAFSTGQLVVVVACRLTANHGPLELPPGPWVDVLVDNRPPFEATVDSSELLSDPLPLRLLERSG